VHTTSTKNRIKLVIILIIIFLIFTISTSSEYIISLFEDADDTKTPDEEYQGIIDVSMITSEAVVISNENNLLELRLLGLNPKIKLEIIGIENGTIQELTIKITNVPIKYSVIDPANNEEYPFTKTNYGIIMVFPVKVGDKFEIKVEKKLDPNNFSYVVLGDTQGRNDLFENMTSMINECEPDFILHCGDMTTMGTEEQFEEFLKVCDRLDAPIFTTPGNHDIKGSSDIYKKFFGPLDYSFSIDGYKFISMDSSKQLIGSGKLTWLENESIDKSSNNILFTHVPPFSSQMPEHLYLDPDDPEKLMEVLEKNRFEYCFSGHLHLYNYSKKNGVNYITTGGGGAAPYAPEEFGGFRHFVHVLVENDISVFDVIRLNEGLLKNKTFYIEIIGPRGKITVDLNDLKTFEYLEGASACQNQYGSWVGNGTYKGVEVERFVELVGGMGKNDTLLVKAVDGYYQEFSYENFYLNDSWSNIQGPFVVSYEYNNEEPPDWSDGLRLITIPPDGGYSLEDCKQTSMPGQGYWTYQSAGARWVKNISSIVVESD
jgi:predicted phosphodiesterase